MATARSRVAALLAGALLALSCLVVAGCGGSTSATLDPVAQAAETTMRQGGAQMSLVAKIEGLSASAMTLQGHGSFNMATQEGGLTATIEGLPAQAASVFPGGKLVMSEMFTNQSVYITAPIFEGRLPNGAKWIKLDIGKLRSKLGIDAQSLASGQANPSELLNFLRGHGASITEVGREDVRGTPTTHYRGSVDLVRELESLPTKNRAAMKATIQKFQESGVRAIPIELWTDSHHLLRKLTLAIYAQQGVHVAITMELFDFGATPTATAPPAQETYDVTSSALGGLLGG